MTESVFVIVTSSVLYDRESVVVIVTSFGLDDRDRVVVTVTSFGLNDRESVVVIVTSFLLDDREIVARLPRVAGDFSVPQKVHICSGAHSASYSVGTGQLFLLASRGLGLNMTKQFHIVQSLRLHEAIPHAPTHIHGMQSDNFTCVFKCTYSTVSPANFR